MRRILLASLLTCAPALGQSLSNTSFEFDTFAVRPGALVDNLPLTSWSSVHLNRVGLNPAGGANDYANNGAVPNGTRVAWIQSDAAGPRTLAQTITGLTPGQAYTVAFRANAKTGSLARFRVALDGATALVGETDAVGGTAAYRPVATVFTASAASHELQVSNISGVNTNNVLLVDAFSVTPGAGGWSYFNWSNDSNVGVDNSKTYTHAYNFGAAGTTVTTNINGVTFTAVTGANPAVGGSFTTTGLGAGPNLDTTGNTAITAGGATANLMRQFVYGGPSQSITLLGLTPGVDYTATLYSAGWEAGVRAATFDRAGDRRTIDQDVFGDNACIAIQHRYRAPASGSVTLAFQQLRAASIHIYGFSNHAEGITPPSLAISPRSRVAAPGSTSVFRALGGGSLPVQYQWRKDGADLPAETNPTLSVGPVDAGSVAGYSVVVSNALGVVTSAVANLTLGPVSNPSFESDVFPFEPGYVSVNAPIIGWDTTTPAQVGVNPVFQGTAPFLNNGSVPDGAQAAFLQSTGAAATLSTQVADLIPGQYYQLGFRMNARTPNVPVLQVSTNGGTLAYIRLSAVGGTAPYKTGAVDFLATGATATIAFASAPATPAQDTATMLDNITVTPVTPRIGHQPWTDDLSSGFNASARVSHAYKLNSAQSTVINDFPVTGVAGATPAVAGKFSTQGFTNGVANDPNTLTAGGGGSAVLGRDFLYAGALQQLIITGLVAGVEYEASLYSVGWDLKAYGRAFLVEAGGAVQTINQDHYDIDKGIRITARYVADATGRGVITVRPTETTSTLHLYGFMNREVASTNAPIFYAQPSSAVVWRSEGVPARVNSALVGGEEPLNFAWHRDGVPVPGQTGRVLDLASPVNADTGMYTLVVSNARGAVTSTPVRVEIGLPALANWSFEAEDYTNGNGYQDTNGGVITGWTFAPANVRLGLNPAAASPFANNGVIPHGAQVAFIQDDTTLSTTLGGLTAGETYFVRFYANARSGYPAPTVRVEADGQVLLPATKVTAGAYVDFTTAFFTATNTTASLTFRKGQGPVVGDSTLLLDAITVHRADVAPPALVVQPLAAYWVAEGGALTLTAQASGTPPLSHQWYRGATPVSGATAASLDLSPAAFGQSGDYHLVITNLYGAATSRVASVNVGYALRGLFSTGLKDDGTRAVGGNIDAHYRLTASADAAFPGPAAHVLADAYPIPPYLANNASSAWIGANPNPASVTNGLYTFETRFLLDEHDPARVRIEGNLAVDNRVLNVRLNGANLGITANGFTVYTPFAITNGFVAGVNVLEFVVSNDATPGPCGLRVEMRGVGLPSSGVAAQITAEPPSLEAQPGGSVRLAAGAVGSATLAYQWYFNGTNMLSGATQPWLNLVNVTEANEGDYTLRVSNGLGNDTSLPARLTVLGPLPVGLTRGPGGLRAAWDATSEPWTVWETPSLQAPVVWTQVPGTITVEGDRKVLTFPEPEGLRYYRLERP